MLFHPAPRRLCKTVENGQELGRGVSRAPSIARDYAKTRVHAKKMRQGSRTTPEDCADQEPAEPRVVLQWVDLLPSKEGNRGGVHRRHILRAPDGLAPRRQARIFVPVEIKTIGSRLSGGDAANSDKRRFVRWLIASTPARWPARGPSSSFSYGASPSSSNAPTSSSWARCAPSPSGSDTAARPISAFKPEGERARCGASRTMRRRAFKTAWVRVSSRVGDRISIVASCKTRSSMWTSSPSIHALAQASIKCVRAIQPSRMGLTRNRSSNRDNASSAVAFTCRFHQRKHHILLRVRG